MNISYDIQGKMKYNPYFHPNAGKKWTEEELEYLCKFHRLDGLATISLALGRTYVSTNQKLSKLRRTGKYNYYKKLDKYYV